MVLCCFWETSQASGKRFSSQQGGADRTKERRLGSKRDRKYKQRRWPSFNQETAILPTPGSMDTAAMWPISEVNLGHSGLSSGAAGCPLTLLRALHQEHTQFTAELLTCHRPPWKPFQRVISTHCLRALVPLGHLGGHFKESSQHIA